MSKFKLEWHCWSGLVEAESLNNGYGVKEPIIAVHEKDYGTCVVLDTPENRAALQVAAQRGLGRNGLSWTDYDKAATVAAHATVRV